MKKSIARLVENELFLILMNGVMAYTAFSAIIIMTLGIPPEAILDTNLQQVIMIFED